MDENIEEIIKIAWQSSPINTEYYLGRYIVDITRKLNKVMDLVGKHQNYESDDSEDYHYSRLLEQEKGLQKEINRLNRLISFLRGN